MPNASVPAAATGLPAFPCDAELVRLGRELEEASHLQRPEPQQSICQKIECIEAVGLAGPFVKARAVELAEKDDEAERNAPGSFFRLLGSLIFDFRTIQTRMINCPVEKIALAASEIIHASRLLEEDKSADHKEDEAQLMERLDDLEQAIVSAPSRSAIGAMAQICVASDLLYEIEAHGFSARIHRQLRRCLYSIIGVIESMSGERAEEFRSYYLSPRSIRLIASAQIKASRKNKERSAPRALPKTLIQRSVGTTRLEEEGFSAIA